MALLATKLKNQIAKINPSYQVKKFRNITVNGQRRGCSGFVVGNGRTVYVNTEESCYAPLAGKVLVRYALDTLDYSGKGGHNEFVPTERTAEAICKMLASEKLLHSPLERRSAQ